MSRRDDVRGEIRQFLITRRAKITPEQAGLRFYGGNRRVPGLRREEVALLAGISIEYYTRLERGNATGVSGEVLDAIARALQLDDVERAHLADLVGELSTRSEEFRGRWAAHDVEYYRSSVQPFHHPIAGDLILDYDALELAADPGLTVIAYTAKPGSPAQQALDVLTTWAAIPGNMPAAQPGPSDLGSGTLRPASSNQ